MGVWEAANIKPWRDRGDKNFDLVESEKEETDTESETEEKS